MDIPDYLVQLFFVINYLFFDRKILYMRVQIHIKTMSHKIYICTDPHLYLCTIA